MTDDERLQLYEALTDTIRAAGLGWVVDEVDDLIEQGLEQEISASEWTGKRQPTRHEARITRREYTPLERVQLLIDATARVVKQGYDVELSVAQFFRNPDRAKSEDPEPTTPPPVDVRFLADNSDVNGDESVRFTLSPLDALEARASAVADLLEQFALVRREASA